MKKPRIKLSNSRSPHRKWVCFLDGVYGWGPDAKRAYRLWLEQTHCTKTWYSPSAVQLHAV